MPYITLSIENPILPEQLTRLRQAAGAGPVLILTHTNPDPDGLSSGVGLAALLAHWQIPSRLVYSGLVGRAENRALLRYLTPDWEYLPVLPDLKAFSAVAMLDTQPEAGNNNLPHGCIADIVIDHHLPIRAATQMARYQDIRAEVGATVSMVYQYLDLAGVDISPKLATAMFYGLRSDTNGLSRGTTTADGVIYVKLLNMLDQHLLLKVEQSGLAREYFDAFHRGLLDAEIVGTAILSFLGKIHRPDLVAEMADMLVRLEDIDAAACMGVFEHTLYFSLRTTSIKEDAGLLVQKIIPPPGTGGGHGTIAGGQYPLQGQDVHAVVAMIKENVLRAVGTHGSALPLIHQP